MRRAAFVAVSLSLIVVASAEVRVSLVVRETAGMTRSKVLVTSGVPLLPGQVKDLARLALLDEAGKPVPCQFRELARWWRADNSLRWVLLDFKSSPEGFGVRRYVLTDAGKAPTDSPLKVTSTEEAIVVTTGPAQFTISRKKFNLFDRVRLDVNGDGAFADEEEAVSPSPDNGSVVTDTYELKYFSGEGTAEVKVEEAGPLRVSVLAKGTHKARDGKGYSLGMYGFEIRMHFVAGTNVVKLDALITNNGAKPNGSPTFEDFSLITRVNVGRSGRRAKVYGVAPVEISVADGQAALLYQDSVGSENWKISPGLEGDVRNLSRFRGYRIIHKAAGKENVLHQGDHARGVAQFGDGRFGVVVTPNYFWQLFPKAVEFSGDGTVRVAIFPGEYKGVHWLEDATAAGQVVLLHFYATGQKAQFARDRQKKPWPHVVDDTYKDPLFARCTPAHYAACGALADIGPYLPIVPKGPAGQLLNEPISVVPGDFPLEITERRYFMTDYLKGNAYGWQVFGCRWEEYAGHSPWNYEPIGSSYFLFNYINTGAPRLFEFGRRRCKHFRDVRAYKIDGVNPFSYPGWREWRAGNVVEDYASRKSKWPTGAEVEKYSQGRYRRRSWYMPNPAHCNLDGLCDLYCLFGDQRALAGMKVAASYGGAYVGPGMKVGVHRATGWCLRALVRYYDLTGDKDALNYLQAALDNCWDLARRERSSPMIRYDNNWFMDVFSRAVVMAFNVSGDERLRDLVIGLSRGRTDSKSGWPTMHGFCWDQTGLAVYANPQWQRYARLGGYFPACAGYLWAKPRADKTAPAAVEDLSARAADGGVELTWTAPGDDGEKGTAAVYQIKYDDRPIVETADGKGNVNFWAAANCTGEPKPGRAGTKEGFVVKGLKAGTWHFALKARDELNNESAISNVVSVEVK